MRAFTDQPVPREQLERLLEAAIAAPSGTNRQPWRFAVVRSAVLRRRLVELVRARTEQLAAVVQRGRHGGAVADYWDYFYKALTTATAMVVPQYRVFPDLIAQLIESGGGDAGEYRTAQDMQVELCAASAAVMTLLLQAHAEGLGACWMSGPMVARDELAELLDIRSPWRPLGVVALGHPAEGPAAPVRKALPRVVDWFEDEAPGSGQATRP